MRDRPRRRTAAVAQTASIALLVAVAVVGISYALQRVLLRPPSHGELAAARIEGALLRYRLVRSTIHVGGEPTRRAECFEGWLTTPDGQSLGRGARVVFSDGERLQLTPHRVKQLSPGRVRTRMSRMAQIQLAGCARSLTNHIYRHLDGHRRARAARATFRGARALRLHVRTSHSRFDLFVHPVTLAPLGIRVVTARAAGWSELTPVRPLTSATLRDFLRRFDG